MRNSHTYINGYVSVGYTKTFLLSFLLTSCCWFSIRLGLVYLRSEHSECASNKCRTTLEEKVN